MKTHFPIFGQHPGLVYLDNAASVQKPQLVIDAVQRFLSEEYANIHRGSYPLALVAEDRRHDARATIATAINAKEQEIIFTGNSTQSVNLLTSSLVASDRLREGDLIVLSVAEHHANILPWQLIARQTGAGVVFLHLDARGQYDLSLFDTIDTARIKIISLTMVSNVLGHRMDTSRTKNLPHRDQMIVVLDASQAVPHKLLDVTALDVDVLYFTGHKVGALTGIGILFGKKQLLDQLSPGIV